MREHRFTLPERLSELIEDGSWPRSQADVNRQNLEPILGEEAAHALSQEDDRIVLMTPPFHTISDEVGWGNDFWTTHLSNVGEIDYAKAVIIADFGLGSDSPIILYYEHQDRPIVMYLKWSVEGRKARQQWIRTHNSFEDFATDVGLIERNA